MHIQTPVSVISRWLLLMVAVSAAAIVGPVQSAGAADRQKQVLVLYSTRRDSQIAIVGDRELPRILNEGLDEGVDFYSEYIDRARFPDPAYKAAFDDFLRLKYQGQRFDLVIAMTDVALEFVGEGRRGFFRDTPVVFFASSSATRRIENSSGVVSELDFSGTVALATRLQPDLRHVFVVSGAENSDKAFEQLARTQFRPLESQLTMTYLSGLPTKALEERLTTLPDHSIVYFVLVSRDGAGENVNPLEYVDRVTAVASAPTYSWVDSAMSHGIVGGKLKNQAAQAAAIAELALRVLRGEPADGIPVSMSDLQVAQVDWRQLRRWGISESRVPAGTLVLFREPSAWDRYKAYILSGAAVVGVQAVLIAGLLVQRARRKKVEMWLLASQTRLRASYERTWDLGKRLISAQEAERYRLARELHDNISQEMAILAIDLRQLSHADQDRLADAGRLADQALDRAEAVGKSLRDLSHRLHPPQLRLIGLVPALERLFHELSRAEFIVTFSHEHVPATLPPDIKLYLFRIAQEALQNAAKHSRAGAVSVHLCGVRHGLALTVVDDGAGFDVEAAQWGLGLIGMRERAEQLGGSLQIHSKPGGGTRLEVIVPVEAADVRKASAG